MSSSNTKMDVLTEHDFQICVIGEHLKNNEAFMKSIKSLKVPVVYSLGELEVENQDSDDVKTIYVLDEFHGEVFERFHKKGLRILGPTSVMQSIKGNMELPRNVRPLYTASMKSLVVTFSGFRSKEEIGILADLVHHMGGSIRKELNLVKTTHLVATPLAISGEKYKFASSSGIPIMTAEWVHKAWEKRNDVDCMATDKELMRYRMLPFVGCFLAFVGYQKDEKQHMTEISTKNGGMVVKPEEESCTHLVVEDGFQFNRALYPHVKYVLKNEWFWVCVEIEAKAEERTHVFENKNILTSSMFIKPSGGNKRKRLESVAYQLANEIPETDFIDPDLRKRFNNTKLSVSGSFIDTTLSPDKTLTDLMSPDGEAHIKSPPCELRSMTPRQQVCLELFQTESNYVKILHTIITVFKEPLEAMEYPSGSLLAPAETKIIFGNLPPIYNIHLKIREELAEIVYRNDEDYSIGNIILNHAPELIKSYPPFVNFFEKTKETLGSCDATKPRFHAFLKRCQSKPECGRQTLQELLIRPVQRLPSVRLLLKDILKHTPAENPDHSALEKAIEALRNVMTHINEDKRKTEGQVEMFDIVNDIDNCPPNLLSSHRNFISKTDVQEVTDLLNKKGGHITMFLFSDVLEICKKKSKYTNSMKSPGFSSATSAPLKLVKSYKHLELFSLSHVKRVIDVKESEECKNIFGIVIWSSKEMKELLYLFLLLDEINKSEFLRALCRHIANSICRADSENLLACLEPHQLDLQTSDSSGNVITKALNKTRSKLGRAWSLRRTPSRRGLSRAVSTIISPLLNLGTPSHSLSTLKLSSVTNLTEMSCKFPEVFLPLSRQLLKQSKTISSQSSSLMFRAPVSHPQLQAKKEKATHLQVDCYKICE